MRPILLAVLLSLVPGPGRAGPRPMTPAMPPSTQSQQFAIQLHGVCVQVNENYVRPVALADLLQAALAGMYESARLSVPADLKQRISNAAARGELVFIIQEIHGRTAPALTALGRDPMIVACQALFRSLDPWSGVINREEQRRNVVMDQEAQGIGVALFDYAGSGPLVVKDVYPGGPAQRAGIRPGDQITQVHGQPVEKPEFDTKYASALGKLLMESGDADWRPTFDPITGLPTNPITSLEALKARIPAKVTFQHPGGRSKTVDLERQHFQVETVFGTGRDDGNRWHFWADREKGIAHIRISMLAHGTSEELAEVLDRLLALDVRGLVLDLRWTPGGYLDESTEIARFFLGDVPVATVKSRNEEDSVYRGGGPSKLIDLPMAVLVNGETSGGAELIAAAMQDHKRAIIVGQRTLGKASVQRPLQVQLQGVQLKLTVGTFFRPSGKHLHRFPESKPEDDWGVKPDVEFRVSPQFGRQLKEWWQAQTLRPGPSMERLPLDDPSSDAQRNAAVDAVAALLDKKPRAKSE